MVTILLVDDDVTILEVTTAILEYSGYDVVSANNGQEALQYLEKGDTPQLILSDTMMPVMDGRELCRRLQANPAYSSIPFVFMSGGLKAPNLGSDGYAAFIAKPYTADDLISTLQSVLAEKKAK